MTDVIDVDVIEYTQCDRCEARVAEDHAVTVQAHWNRTHPRYHQVWCRICVASAAIECVHCGEYVAEGIILRLDGGCCACESCDEDHHNYCSVCEVPWCLDEGEAHEECISGYDDNVADILHDYTYTPRLEFRGEGPRYLGMELEVGAAGIIARQIHDQWEDLLYCKEDSSVDGFEIVTHPMTYDWAVRKFPWQVLDLIKSNGEAGPNGLHVHISRSAFESRSHLNSFVHLMYVNADMVKALARRDPSRWAKFELVPFNDSLYDKSHRSRGQLSERYSAVNTTNSETIEMRVWASTLDKTEILAALGLVDAACVYTEAHQDLEHLDWEHFCGWVFARGEEYAELVEEMHRRCVPLMTGRGDPWQKQAAEKQRRIERDAENDRRWLAEQRERTRVRDIQRELGDTPERAAVNAEDYAGVAPDAILCECEHCQSVADWLRLGEAGYRARYEERMERYLARERLTALVEELTATCAS